MWGGIVVVGLGSGLYLILGVFFHDGGRDAGVSGEPSAAIVDQLSAAHGNETFVEECTSMLQEAGFTVDYYASDSVTVEFFRKLPTRGYGLLVLRVHCATYHPDLRVVALFSSERYSQNRYVGEQLNDQVSAVAFAPYEEGDPTYFGITDRFVVSCMEGQFDDTIVVMMGCDSMRYHSMADAFVERGASVYVGWDDLVSTPHTDRVTIDLLRRLLFQGHTVAKAVAEAMATSGADPYYGGVLSFYPVASGNCTVGELLSR